MPMRACWMYVVRCESCALFSYQVVTQDFDGNQALGKVRPLRLMLYHLKVDYNGRT